jgi:Flp pilus assembly CpaE family ATPase
MECGLLFIRPVEEALRKSGGISEANRFSGSVFSLVPAHGASRVGAVAEQLSRTLAEGSGVAVLLADFQTRGYPVWHRADAPHRLDGRTWGAFVAENDGFDMLDASDVNPRELSPLLDYARENYQVVCADLTGAREPQSAQTLRASDAIFVVSGSDRASLESVREKVEWLHSLNVDERCALLLQHEPTGVSAADAEEISGLPVCSLIDSEQQIAQLAHWLVANSSHVEAEELVELALAG